VSKAGQFALDAPSSAEFAMRNDSTEDTLLLACEPPGSPLELRRGIIQVMQTPQHQLRCDSCGHVVRWTSASQTSTSSQVCVSSQQHLNLSQVRYGHACHGLQPQYQPLGTGRDGRVREGA
jgi:hypothetical protein